MLRDILLHLFCFFFFTSCAKIVALEGGPEDTISPVLISQKPNNDICGVSTKKKFSVTLKFDKNIYLRNPDQIIITPKLTTKGDNEKNFDCFNDDDSVTLVIYSGLEPNTTYSVNFNNTIIGFRNDKPLENKIVSFSTGDSVDKNIFCGTVFDPINLQPLKNGIVCLYDFKNYDDVEVKGVKKKVHSNIISSKEPDYFTRTDAKGNFTFTNPIPGKYLCCAGESKDGKPYCNPATDVYGFNTVEIKKNAKVKSVIDVYDADVTDFKIISSQSKGRYFDVKFSKKIKDYELKVDIRSKLYQNVHIFSQLLEDMTTVRIFNYGLHLIDDDTLRTRIIAHDKLGNKLEEKIFIKFSTGQNLPSEFKIFISNENLKKTTNDGLRFKISTSLPLIKFDFEKILLIINEKYPLELNEKDFSIDKHRNEILINKQFNLQDFLENNDPLYKMSKASEDNFIIDVLVQNNALESVLRSKNKEVKKKFIYSTKNGSISGRVFCERNAIVQLLNEQFEVVDESKKSNFNFENLAPGKYFLRAFLFKGKTWNCGNIFELTQPDRVRFYNEMIEVLPNWKKENIIF